MLCPLWPQPAGISPESLLFDVACFLVEDSKLAPTTSDLPPRILDLFLVCTNTKQPCFSYSSALFGYSVWPERFFSRYWLGSLPLVTEAWRPPPCTRGATGLLQASVSACLAQPCGRNHWFPRTQEPVAEYPPLPRARYSVWRFMCIVSLSPCL